MKIKIVALVLTGLLAIPVFAAGPSNSIVIGGQRFSLSEDLLYDPSLAADFARPDKMDISPDGRFAVAVHIDRVDPNRFIPTARLLVVDMQRKAALRELWAWRMATVPGFWQPDGTYVIHGGVPNGHDERSDTEAITVGTPLERFIFDPRTGLIDKDY